MDAFRLVIVGGGIAGMELATRLGRRRGLSVTLVDRTLAHVWKPMLHGFAAGTARPDREKIGYLAHAKRHGYRFVAGALDAVDRDRRTVSIVPFGETDRDPRRTIAFDALVLAIGSRANDFGTEGVAEHCAFIDDLTEAEAFHDALRLHLFRVVEGDATIDIAIVGGGATGVELAAELKRATDIASGYGSPSLASRLRLSLIESGDRLLASFPESVSAGAERTLRGLGVDIRVGAMVTAADADGFVLKDGSRIDAALKVWAAGVKAPEATGAIEGLERDHAGRLAIRPSLQTTRDDHVFALGDCASLTDPATGRPVPSTAQAARQQSLHLARGFGGWLRTGRMRPFRYEEKGQIVSLADFNGWGTLGSTVFGGGRLRGLSARFAHDLLYRQHQLELHGLARGAMTWLVDDLDRVMSPGVRLD